MNEGKRPLIVVKRKYYDQFQSGEKSVEYRRLRGQFNPNVFSVGRDVRIAYNYNVSRFPTIDATVVSFEAIPASRCPELLSLCPDMAPDEQIAAIHLSIDRAGPLY